MATTIGSVVFQISADLKGLQGQLRTMESQFQSSFGKIESVVGKASSVLSLFGVGLGAGAVVQFGREVLNLADNLQNLHDQTGVSVELLSGIKSPLEEAGSSVDAFARGVFNLQKNLGNVDKDTDPAAQAIKRLGLNLDELRNTNPDQFIKRVTDSLGQIQNPVERNTILFNLLGKSAKELGPAFEQLAGRFDEFRAKGLSADMVKNIDDVGDALTRLKNQALALGAEGVAGLLRFFGVFTERGKLIESLLRTQKEIDDIDARLARRKSLREKGLGFFTPSEDDDKKQLQRRKELEADLRKIDQQVNALNASEAKPTEAFKPLATISKTAKTAESDVRNFFDSLEKQLASLETKQIELTLGPSEALGAELDAQFKAFTEKLAAEKLPIPKGLTEEFEAIKAAIIGANEQLLNLQNSLKNTTGFVQAFADEANEGVGIQFISAEQNRRLFEAGQQFDKLSKGLAIDAIDTSTPEGKRQQQWARMQAEAQETAQRIEELGRQSGKTEEEIAAAVSNAWAKAYKEIGVKAEESTVFQERAWERMHDAIGDLTTDLLTGQIKSWEDFGSRVAGVIQSITAEFISLQLKAALFGEAFGSKGGGGGQVGGLLGSLLQALGFGGGSSQFSTPIGGSFNTEELIWGGMASVAHSGGIVGASGMPRRSVPAAVFIDAPRYHSGGWAGLRPDEMPIIAQRGERILPRWASGYSGGGQGGGSGNKTSIIINNNTGQPVEQERRTGSDGVEEILITLGKRMAKDIRAGRDLGQSISQTYGLQRAPVNRG